jgi:hypothetical protein
MAQLDVSLSDSTFIDEVRTAMAGLDSTKIPDDTIVQAKDRFVEPLLNDSPVNLTSDDQDAFDNAAIAWTAEFAFDAWLTYTRLRDAEVEAYTDPNAYKRDLKSRTNKMLGVLGLTRPSDIPNQVISIQHDGKRRSVNLDANWVVETYSGEGVG